MAWLPLGQKTETAEHRFWQMHAPINLVVYDIGAFHGLMTLFFSRHASHVFAFEPNSRNRARLNENLVLNDVQNVTVIPVAVGNARGIEQMDYDPLFGGGATVRQHDSLERHMAESRRVTETIEITSIDQELAEGNLAIPDLIKIDIEGYELAALKGAENTLRSHSPALFLEMHGETMNEKRRKVAEIVEFLLDVGYSSIYHVESEVSIDVENSAIAAQGHLYCMKGTSS